jgi:hypothetical protein
MSSESILVEVSESDIQSLLEKQFYKSSVKEELVKLIMATNYESFQKMNLYKTLVGVDITPKVQIGTKYWVEQYNLQSWNFDKEEMKKEKLLVENCVLCEVIGIDKYKERPIGIAYTYINGNHQETQGTTEVLVKELKIEHKEIDF